MTPDLVFDIIVGERQYQARRWGEREWNGLFRERSQTVGEFLVYMKHYLDEAFMLASTEPGYEKTLDTLRKVVALGVACFEQHGVPPRDNSHVINGRDGLSA